MKKILFIGVFLFIALYANAQISGLTETGDEIILYQDGTWKYINEELIDSKSIEENSEVFIKDKSLTFLVKSKKVGIGLYINPKKWNFKKSDEGDVSEFTFEKKSGDLYGMLISEKLELPVESLADIAFDNAKSAAPDIKIIEKEYRTVNGVKVIMLRMSGTIQGIKFTYYGYYYSNSEGTIQLLAYTSTSLFNEYKKEIKAFLNGMVVLE